MVPASVGFQCPECVAAGRRETAPARTAFGGSLTRSSGVVTVTLIALNLVAFGAQHLLGNRVEYLFGMVGGPAYFPDRTTGGVADGQYWRLLTNAFLHTGLLHIAVNMFSLWQIGPLLERLLGRARFLAVYLVSALGASVAVYWFAAPSALTVGASGAVFGIFGAAIVLWRKSGYDIRPALVVLGVNVVFNIFLSSALSWQGHLGGLLTGTVLAVVLGWAPGTGATRARNQWIGIAAVTVLLIAAVALRTANLG